eukprot:SAG31_NODE_237_length_19590_cov_13.149915_8_plen_296_part_00
MATNHPLVEGQLRQLVQQGYVVLDAFIDPTLTAAARDRLWDFSLPRMRRDDPSTHTGPFAQHEHTTVPTANRRYGFRWQVTAMGQEDVLLDLLPRNPAVRAVVAQLLGARFTDSAPDWSNMGRPEQLQGAWTRGVYCTLPTPLAQSVPLETRAGCHIDSDLGSRDRLGAIAYIDDVVCLSVYSVGVFVGAAKVAAAVAAAADAAAAAANAAAAGCCCCYCRLLPMLAAAANAGCWLLPMLAAGCCQCWLLAAANAGCHCMRSPSRGVGDAGARRGRAGRVARQPPPPKQPGAHDG